jgi:hypothetical protein
MPAACSQSLAVLVTASTLNKLSLAKVREIFDHCLLKFGSCSQVFGSFAQKIALGEFFSLLSSDLHTPFGDNIKNYGFQIKSFYLMCLYASARNI